jgi:pilus assembly protein FimV
MAFNKEKVMDAARKFVDKGQLDKAIKEYLRVVKEDPADVRVWLKIGDLHARKGQKQEATETYLKVARYYQDQGFFTKAVAVFKQILKLDPRLVEVHLKLAELYRQLGLMSDAMQHFESVAAHFHREGKTKEALATVRQLVDLDPQNVATRIKLAELYSKEQMVEEAVAEFSQVCEQLRRQNRQDDFVKVAERLLWHRPENRDLNRELAGLYLRRGDPRRALQKLQICFKSDPRDVETLALLAQAFQALDQKGKTVSVLKELARVFEEAKQRVRAEEVYRKILAFAPGDPDAIQFLGGNAAAAVVAAAPAAAEPIAPAKKLNWTGDVPALRPPGDARMTGAMPLVDERSLDGDFALPDDVEGEPVEMAEQVYERSNSNADFAADFDGDSSHRHASAAGEEHAEEIAKILTETDVYVKYGLHQKAIEHLRRVFALDPDNVEARERLKDVLLSQGREQEAIAELLRLAESTAPHDAGRAEGYVREVLAVDGANQPALELTRRFGLDISIAPDVEVIDGGSDLIIDPDELASGGVAPVEEDIDFDDIDFGDPSRPRFDNMPRADSFDGIDPAMFDRPSSRPGAGGSAGSGGSAAGRAGSPRAMGSEHDFSHDSTRQVAAAEVQALVARTAREGAGDVAMGSPPPFRAPSPRGNQRSLSDALDASLDDSMADDIDAGVAAELGELGARPGFQQPGYDSTEGDAMLPLDDDELPFDPAAAREFDAVMRGGRHKDSAASDGGSSAPTFDPGAAAAFDAERDEYGGPPSAAPTPEHMGAHVLPAESFENPSYDSVPGYSTAEEAVPEYGDYQQGPYADAAYVDPYVYDQGGTIDQPVEGFAPTDGQFGASAAPRTLEDDLDDADYYMQHGMYDEADEVLRALQARHPHHPLVAARLRDLEAQIAAQHGDTGEPVESVDDELVQAASGGTETVDVDDLEEIEPEEAVDDDEMAAAFDEAQRVIAGRGDAVGHHAPPSSRPAVVLEKPLEDSDGDTHFDLGLAYKEMGLYDEAIKAFEKVAHTSTTREVQSRMMIGMCQRDQGNLSEAVHQFKAGLHAGSINDRERQTLLYEIGATYEALGDPRESVYYFEMVVKRDPAFLDARDRLARLRGGRGRRGALDETGDAIDSLLADDV